jgi:putative flippase GtrA
VRGIITLAKSGAVGAVATIADLAALALLVQVAGLRPEAANVPALLVGLAVQFVGNKLWAFGDRSTDRLLRQGTLFLAVEAGALALNAAVFHLLVTSTTVPYPVARVAGQALVYFGFSYPIWTRLFRRSEPC